MRESKAKKIVKVSVDDKLYSELNRLSGDMLWSRSQLARKVLEYSFNNESILKDAISSRPSKEEDSTRKQQDDE